MREKIDQKLREIEEQEQVKIILAAESGSRAWGFASPDSDYDVRFIYVRQPEAYLSLRPVRDVIEWQLDDVLDINGWDIKKVLQLLKKSNPTIFEWCNSSIIYKKSEDFRELEKLLPQYFSIKKSLYHYWNMADNNRRTYLGGKEVKIKKYFYILRPILASDWIIEKKSPPPVLLEDLVRTQLPEKLKEEIESLSEQKRKNSELGIAPAIPAIEEYIEESLDRLKDLAKGLEERSDCGWEALEQCFLRLIGIGRYLQENR